MPKVSVIVPIYGVEQFLRKAIDSVLNQTLRDLEIILIDDGGKDSCPQIIDEYAQKDNRIIAIHKKNGGYGATCNLGLETATGEYIAILEPDDYISPKMYEDLYNIAQTYNSDIVKSSFYNNYQCEHLHGIKKEKWKHDLIPQNKSFTIKECSLFLYYHPSIWSCIYKKEFLDKHNIRFVEAPGAGWTDNPFQVQTMCLAERINYTPEAYYYWRNIGKEELKDYKLPFLRSEEIHAWLEKNNINSPNIFRNLAKRELAYIDKMFQIKKVENIKDCCKRIKNLCILINKNCNVLLSSNFTFNEKRNYIFYRYYPLLLFYHKELENYRRHLIQIRWNKKEKFIKLFNKTIYKK